MRSSFWKAKVPSGFEVVRVETIDWDEKICTRVRQIQGLIVVESRGKKTIYIRDVKNNVSLVMEQLNKRRPVKRPNVSTARLKRDHQL